MSNVRSFYAIESILFKNNADPPTNEVASFNDRHFSSGCISPAVDEVGAKWEAPRGVQSVGVTTDYNREQVFQLGQVELYEYSERQPSVEFTMEKAVDGTKPLYLMVTDPDDAANIIAKTARYRTDAIFEIFPDNQFRATSAPRTALLGSGLYLSNVTYTFPIDGFVTESITLVGNDKIWSNFDAAISGVTTIPYRDPLNFPVSTPNAPFDAPEGAPSGQFGHESQSNASEQAGAPASLGVRVVGSGITRREEVDISRSILPFDLPGIIAITSSGVPCTFYNANAPSGNTITVAYSNTKYLTEHLQTITATADIGREDIFELGSKRPFFKYVTYPIEITCSFEVITSEGDLADARSLDSQDNTAPSNTIIIRTTDGLQVDLGDRNALTSVNMTGGDTGGGNITQTFNYTTFNDWYVSHDRWQKNHRMLVKKRTGSRWNKGFGDIQVPAGFPSE